MIATSLQASTPPGADPANGPKPPAHAACGPGIPVRDAQLDVLPGFQNPPQGYGEVPYWWWTGEKLDKERLLWQLEELHKAGVSGTQINYAMNPKIPWRQQHPTAVGQIGAATCLATCHNPTFCSRCHVNGGVPPD